MNEADPRLYNVNRDVAHNFRQVMERVFNRLQQRLWPELESLLSAHQVTDREVSQAFDALCKFIGGAQDNMRVEFQTALAQAGWFKCRPEAQVAVMSVLGTVILGYHFAGVREATLGGEGPALTLTTLASKGEELAAFLAIPRWKRPFVRFWRRLSRAWRLLLGRE